MLVGVVANTGSAPQPEPLAALAAEIREAAWDVAVEVVEEGARGEAIPSLARLGRLGQLGELPSFVAELARELAAPRPGGLEAGSALTRIVRDHARARKALGFTQHEIVTELLLVRRVLWRFVRARTASVAGSEVTALEGRATDGIDRLVTECVAAYVDRVVAELAERARRDPLTELLNHRALTDALELELERARRYDHGLTLVYLDVDGFKRINDTLGHPVGDRVLRALGRLVRDSLRRTDVAGRMGGDELAAVLIESEADAGGHFLARLEDRIDELAARDHLPAGLSVSGGLAHYPSEAADARALFRLADERLYAAKRAKQV
jgi:diguanylate cyclase (GGDEF)-like protein